MEIELETIHLAILAVTVVAILIADHEGWSYMRGRKIIVDARRVHWLHMIVGVGLLGMIISGGLMVWPYKDFYFTDFVFVSKMFFVGALVINALFIGRVMQYAVEKPYAALSSRERTMLVFSGGVSVVGWVAATIIGFFFL